MEKINYGTTQGILDEIQQSANDFIESNVCNDKASAIIRAKNCDIALKIHQLEHIKERFQTVQMEKQIKLEVQQALLQEDKFD